ncbi:MAG: outer membrane lipoprotein-sorting protein [Myxococcales bacterium]|nr:outer membrane lipoprotein-sorting protein [Myxococcales bacterium]
MSHRISFIRCVPILGAAFALLSSSWLVAPPAVRAEDGPSADELARRTLRADSFAWEGANTRLRMVLVGKDGKRRERSMEVVARRHQGLLQTLVRFLAPQELAGTAFLMRETGSSSSEQYIYLSGLKRTRRVVGREREGSFMGSDFSYADMQRIDPKHTRQRRLPDDKVGSVPTFVLETTIAEGAGSRYGKLVTWIRKSDFVAIRTRFHDRSGKLVKTLYARKVKQLEGKPVVVEARMQSETGTATELHIESMQRRDDLSDSMFTPAALERM